MPPKKAPAGKKGAAPAKTQKIVEDKTFGMKNKKSAKAQKYVQTVQKQVENQKLGPKARATDRSSAQKQKADELDSFLAYKPAVVQKPVEKGVDPKSVVCQFFKQGSCKRGKACKFSHDLEVERKVAKIDLFTDTREDDDMEEWDQEKLETVVEKRHGVQNANKTDIVCKYFIEAVENKKYGWFWSCVNGDSCIYRHALPPGYVFKKDKKAEEEEEVDILEVIEEKRAQLKEHTPVTHERFLEWKKMKNEKKELELKAKRKQRKADIKSGKVQMSGREMFTFNPDLFVDDDMAANSDEIKQEMEELDASIPVNIITATGTSITRTAVLPKSKEGAEAAEPALVVSDASLFDDEDVDLDEDLE